MPDAFEELAGRIGRDTAEMLRAEGWQPPPSKSEPARIVTMDESRERYVRFAVAEPFPTPRETAEQRWRQISAYHDANNAADNWLLKTANRRLIGGLPRVGGFGDFAWMDQGRAVHLPSALRLFCGEGA